MNNVVQIVNSRAFTLVVATICAVYLAKTIPALIMKYRKY